MTAFFLSLVMVPRVKKSPEFRSRVRIIMMIKKGKEFTIGQEMWFGEKVGITKTTSS